MSAVLDPSGLTALHRSTPDAAHEQNSNSASPQQSETNSRSDSLRPQSSPWMQTFTPSRGARSSAIQDIPLKPHASEVCQPKTLFRTLFQVQRQQACRLAANSGAGPAMTASSIVEEFYAVQQPATYNIRYSEALKVQALYILNAELLYLFYHNIISELPSASADLPALQWQKAFVPSVQCSCQAAHLNQWR